MLGHFDASKLVNRWALLEQIRIVGYDTLDTHEVPPTVLFLLVQHRYTVPLLNGNIYLRVVPDLKLLPLGDVQGLRVVCLWLQLYMPNVLVTGVSSL